MEVFKTSKVYLKPFIMNKLKSWFKGKKKYNIGLVLSGGGARGFAHAGIIKALNEGDIVPAIMASSAIPVLFNPVEIDGTIYVDGGVLDNMPVHPIYGKCNKIIGAYLNPIQDEKEFNTLFMIAERTFRLSVSANIEQKLEQIDVVIEVRGLEKFGMLDAGKGNEMFELGYEQAKKIIS